MTKYHTYEVNAYDEPNQPLNMGSYNTVKEAHAAIEHDNTKHAYYEVNHYNEKGKLFSTYNVKGNL